jgi:hypothetical protein
MDYDIHGFAGVRVGEGARLDQLGEPRDLDREPDISIRFVEQLAPAALTLIGLDECGYDEESFYVLRPGSRAILPMDRIGERLEVVCELGGDVPFLRELVNMAALANGAVPVHAAAFEYEGKGFLVTGWSRGGKTEVLLAFTARGARYVGDEWIYVSGDGSRLHTSYGPVTLWDWNLDDLPEYRARISRADRIRMRAIRRVRERAPSGAGLVSKAARVAERRGSVQASPQVLFEDYIASCAFDQLILAVSTENDSVSVKPADPAEVARRMAAGMVYEHRDLLEQYEKFRFAFPDRRSDLLDRLEERYANALARAFADKPAHVLAHPYPAHIPSLYDAMRPLL